MTHPQGQRVLVTGAAGFTGRHLTERLLLEGFTVRAMVRDAELARPLEEAGAELVVADLRDHASIERAVENVDSVYHIAAIFREANKSKREMFDVNVTGTQVLLDASIAAGVQRFVHCSTVGVHGDIKDPPAKETAPYAPADAYQESKLEGERLVHEYIEKGLLPISVFRPAGIYGPRDLRFLKLFKWVQSGRFAMLGSGEIPYQLIFIDDLIDGILLCGNHESAIGEVFILTGEHPATLNELVAAVATAVQVDPPRHRIPLWPILLAGIGCDLLCRPFGIDPPLHPRRVDFFRNTRSFDISKARELLGFAPKVDLQTGFERTVAWYHENGHLLAS